MLKTCSRLVSALVREYRAWTDDVGEDLRTSSEALLEQAQSLDARSASHRMASSLSRLGIYYGTHGLCSIAAASQATETIHLAVAYHHWALRFTLARYRMTGVDITLWSGDAACVACYSMSYKMKEWIGTEQALLQYMSRARGAFSGKWDARPFERFVLELADKGLQAGSAAPSGFGTYSSILEHWSNPSSLSSALEAVLDYHCSHILPKPKIDLPEFEHAPFSLIPWEVIAVVRLRRQLGLDTPLPNHPLMEFATSFLQEETPKISSDAVLERARVYFEDNYPDS